MKPKNIDDSGRLEACKELILKHRATAGAKASYELYGILFGRKMEVDRVDHAPTSGDFAPMIAKKRIAQLVDRHAMVVEFRGAWKSDTEGKVVAYESQQQADINAAK